MIGKPFIKGERQQHAPRGAKCWRYGWAEIALATGHTIATAKRYGQGKDRRFNPASLRSIVAYAAMRGKTTKSEGQ